MTDILSVPNDHSPREIPSCWSLQFELKAGRTGEEPDGWAAYWERLNDNHQLFREQSDEYVRNLASALPLEPRAWVLDFGCGFGFVAGGMSTKVGQVFLWDTSANMRRHARVNLLGRRNIRFLDLSGSNADNYYRHFDLILVNSVAQYMTLDEFLAWLVRWRRMLAPDGRIVISDLIPPDYLAVWDIVDLLRFAARRGFLAPAIWDALGEIWRYWRVRKARPLSRIGRTELSRWGEAAGLSVSYLTHNLTHFTKRNTVVLREMA